jgi:hypothetical protein
MYAVGVIGIVAGLLVTLRDSTLLAGALALCRLADRPADAAQIGPSNRRG